MTMELAKLLPSLGFLGAGNMAGAILKGTVGRGLLPPERVWACDVLPEKLEALRASLGINITPDPRIVLQQTRYVVLATKPQDLPALLQSLSAGITAEHCLISIAAGLTIARLAAPLAAGTRLVRVMPNTPALVGFGAAGVAGGPGAQASDVLATLALFEAVGIAREVREEQLDAVTALSGSGPAYIFRLMEIMMRAGEDLGLASEIARDLTLQTVLGAAQLAGASEEGPAQLRARVTSKGGTTAAALEVFERMGLSAIISAGMQRARERSEELGKGL